MNSLVLLNRLVEQKLGLTPVLVHRPQIAVLSAQVRLLKSDNDISPMVVKIIADEIASEAKNLLFSDKYAGVCAFVLGADEGDTIIGFGIMRN